MGREVLRSLQAAVTVNGDRVILRRGQEVPSGISDDDRARLERRGSIVDEGDLAQEELQREAFKDAGESQKYGEPAVQSSGDELVDWITDDQPTIDEVLARAGDDPELATRLFDAESAATGGEPRPEVVAGLTAVASGVPVTEDKDSRENLVAWLKSEPNVKETVAEAGGDPDLAEKILDAEIEVTDGDPRVGVVEGLQKIIKEGREE